MTHEISSQAWRTGNYRQEGFCTGGKHDGKQVSWLPSYGPKCGRYGEQQCRDLRQPGGFTGTNSCNALIVMNKPSLEKFESWVMKGGI